MHYRNSLARKWDQSRIETQQGKHHILQLHVQHLGLVIYHLGYKGLGSPHLSSSAAFVQIASLLGLSYCMSIAFLNQCPMVLASPMF